MKLFLMILLAQTQVFAAPIPGTGSSQLAQSGMKVSFVSQGFDMDFDNVSWMPEKNSGESFNNYRFKSPTTDGQLSIRVDKLATRSNIEQYSKKWIRDYPNYGFEILNTKPVSIKGEKGLIIDLAQKEHKRQIRQMVMMKDQTVVIMTCQNSFEQFKDTASKCNKLFSSFKWL